MRYFSYLNFVFNLCSRGQKSIREYFEKVAPEMAVGQDEATQFENEWKANPRLVTCTKEDFRLYFDGTPLHVWNSTAICMLSRKFVSFYQLQDAELIPIENGMIVRFKSLKRAYNMLQHSQAIQNLEKRLARRRMRKSQAWITFPL